MAQTQIVFGNRALFAATSHQLQHIARKNLADSPEFVDLVRVSLAALRWMNVNGARSWIGTLLRDAKDNRITRFEIVLHLVPPWPKVPSKLERLSLIHDKHDRLAEQGVPSKSAREYQKLVELGGFGFAMRGLGLPSRRYEESSVSGVTTHQKRKAHFHALGPLHLIIAFLVGFE